MNNQDLTLERRLKIKKERIELLEHTIVVLYKSVGKTVRYESETPGTTTALELARVLTWERKNK